MPDWLFPTVIVAAVVAVYANSMHGPFIFDDLHSIRDNPRVKNPGALWEGVTNTARPVVWLTLAANWAIGGGDVQVFHLTNILIHACSALVLWGVVRRTCKGTAHSVSRSQRTVPKHNVTAPLRMLSAQEATAGAVALLWAVHPLNTQAVTYIIQRGESLSALFVLLTLYCAIRAAEEQPPPPVTAPTWSTLTVVSCALGMATKPVALVAPVLVLAHDAAFRPGRLRWKLYGTLAATWLILPVVLANGRQEWAPDAGFDFGDITWGQFVATQPGVLLHYLWLAVWPVKLCLDYGWPVEVSWLGVAVVVALMGGTVWLWWKKRELGFLGVWFFLCLAPSSALVPIRDLCFEHRMYLALIAVVAGFVVATRRSLLVCLPVAFVLGVMTVERNRDYQSELRIWQDTVDKAPENARAHYNYGVALHFQKRSVDGIGEFREALRLRPKYPKARKALATALVATGTAAYEAGDLEEAQNSFAEAVVLNPRSAGAHFKWGLTLQELGRTTDAAAQYRQALQVTPTMAEAHNNLGTILFTDGKVKEAAEHFREAARLRPGYEDAEGNLRKAEETIGR